MNGDLADRACVPCRRGAEALSPDAVERLLSAVPAWAPTPDGTRIRRDFTFRDYAEALALVVAVSALAEAERHHPDVAFGWGYVTLSLTTHAANGLHDNDFILAAKIDRLTGC